VAALDVKRAWHRWYPNVSLLYIYNVKPCLRKSPLSPYWQAVLWLPSGKRTNRSTKKTKRSEAMKVAKRMQQTINKIDDV